MMQAMKTDILIIGAGPVGLFTVFQAGMLGMKCHIVDALPDIGGQCAALYPEKPIYDIPSRPMVTGANLIDNLKLQADPFDPVYHLGQQVESVEKLHDEWRVTTSKGTVIEAKVVIIAAGAGAFVPNRPPLNGIEDFEDQSVFYVVRQKDQFAGKNIVIAGGGDSAVDWAISLANVAKTVTVIHRRDKFRAMDESVAQMHQLATDYPDRFRIKTPYQPVALTGDNGQLTSMTLADMDGVEEVVPADALIALYGLKPSLGPIAEWDLTLHNNAILVDPQTCHTSQEGIYAVGDIATYNKKLKLILTGFAEAASACHDAYARVFPDKELHFEYSTSKGVS